jgi:hypothetical protein
MFTVLNIYTVEYSYQIYTNHGDYLEIDYLKEASCSNICFLCFYFHILWQMLIIFIQAFQVYLQTQLVALKGVEMQAKSPELQM